MNPTTLFTANWLPVAARKRQTIISKVYSQRDGDLLDCGTSIRTKLFILAPKTVQKCLGVGGPERLLLALGLQRAACHFLFSASSTVAGTPGPSSRCQPSCPAKGGRGGGSTKGSQRPDSLLETVLNIRSQCGRPSNLPAATSAVELLQL